MELAVVWPTLRSAHQLYALYRPLPQPQLSLTGNSIPPSLQAALAAGLTMGLVSLEQRAYLKRRCTLLLPPEMRLPPPRPVELQIIEAAC